LFSLAIACHIRFWVNIICSVSVYNKNRLTSDYRGYRYTGINVVQCKDTYYIYIYIYYIIYIYIGASRPSPSSEIGRHNIITTGDFQSSIGNNNNNNNNALSVPHEPIILYTRKSDVGKWINHWRVAIGIKGEGVGGVLERFV